ncbi:MAG: hypothetical protein DRJ01_14155 [Bacteroidetes bacterium]|nr:MAG: hypothetical protein DRJ01_14155 [Bacteroidota bacterium]
MILEIGRTISATDLKELEHLSSFGTYEIFWLNEDPSFIIAIDNANLICSCFEFVERYDGLLLAHMHTLSNLKGLGIGKTILIEAVKCFIEFNLPPTSDEVYYFIEDGYGWIQKRFDDGTLKEPPFKRPD